MINQFTTLTSTAIPLKIENVDTDQIIPARFLKATTREGFGKQLFFDWRYDAQGNPKTDFVLNSPDYTGEILIAGKNFGCGSSREHAAWAIYGADFQFFRRYFPQQCPEQRITSCTGERIVSGKAIPGRPVSSFDHRQYRSGTADRHLDSHRRARTFRNFSLQKRVFVEGIR